MKVCRTSVSFPPKPPIRRDAMSLARFLSISFFFGLALSLVSCTPEDKAVDANYNRYRVEVLAYNIDLEIIPDRFVADFDEDGKVDRIILNDSSLQIDLTGGGEFSYSVRERGQESFRIWDAKVFSLRQDGKFPSIVMATCPHPSHEKGPVVQHIVYNDSGRLVLKRLGVYPITKLGTSPWAYPMRALGLDCAWLESNDLPVCFYASMEDGYLGVSRLIEFDVNGYQRLATDSSLRSFYFEKMQRQLEWARRFIDDTVSVAEVSRSTQNLVWGLLGVDSATLDRILRNYLPHQEGSVSDTLLAALDWLSQSSPRERARAYLHIDGEAFDSILAESNVQEPNSAADFLLAVAFARLDHEALFSHDVTQEYCLPWPAQYGHTGPGVDGTFMIDAIFLDFSGDGLLDLVVVGEHSRPFSAIQHPDGYFTNAGYHGVPDEYVRVWAPKASKETEVTVPPCVYFGMEKTEEQAWRSDYIECYDQALNKWYEVTLPEGPYWTEYEPVMFWDMNNDGMIDFAARREDGSWNLLTFVQE
jgi:hypothetical protein